MQPNAIFFGWNRAIPGREQMSGEHFREFVQYLDGLKSAGSIHSYDVVFLNAHGGDMNGFFLIKGDGPALREILDSDTWTTHMTRATLHLQSAGSVAGVTGGLAMERMKIWSELIAAQ